MKRIFASLTLLSISLIAYQIVLMSILSLVQWYHFAAMVISVALLGFGASGAVLTLTRSWCLRNSAFLVPLSMSLSGFMMPLVILLSQREPIRFDVFRFFFDFPDVIPLLLTYTLFIIPFFFGSLAIGILFTQHTDIIGRLYFFNLLGSGLGALLAVGSAWLFPPQQLPSIFAFFPIAAGALLAVERQRTIQILVSASAVLAAVYFLIDPPNLVLSEYKSLNKTLHLPEANVEYRRPSPRGMIHVVSSPALRSAPGLSLRFQGVVPPQVAIFNNGDWFGSIAKTSRRDSTHLLDHTTLRLPFLLERKATALVLESQSGMRVSQALANGVETVTAVESHSTVLSLLNNELAVFNDSLYYDPRVRLVSIDSRTHLLGDTSTYDLILLPLLEVFGGTSGLFALQEQFSLTKEAFGEMWNRLNPEGTISVSAWLDYPPRTSLKILATLARTFEEAGISEIENHLAAVKSWGTVTFVAKKTPLLDSELRALRAFCEENSFDPLLLPDLDRSERDRFNFLADTLFAESIDAILSARREEFLKEYPFRVTPATDERPFFSQFLRWDQLGTTLNLVGERGFPFLEMGSLLLIFSACQVLLLAVILILLPLAKLRGPGARISTILYFSSLGVGYMLVEIMFIQQFTLYWGHPVLAAAAVLGIMLVASGCGSALSSRLGATTRSIRTAGIIVTALLVVFAVFLFPVLRSSIALPFPLKFMMTVILLVPLSFVMGLMFPLGLRRLNEISKSQVPWAWGINGATAVVGGSLSVLLLVEVGSTNVLLLASFFYAAASLVIQRTTEKK
ncbi:MAG: spermidine synthase-like protein [Ignavibacteriales bacterium]|nr:spermidine synthase-like protein [Ignavibacteriales bacterium]